MLGSHVRCREAALLVSVGAREHGTVGGHVSEGFLDSWRSAAPFCMSTDGPSSCQWCTRSARSGRTARGRCGARTRRARASQRTPSCTAGLAEGAAAALPRRAWGKELLWLQREFRAEKWFKGRARARRIPRSNRHPTTPIVLRGVRASSTESAILPKGTVCSDNLVVRWKGLKIPTGSL